MMISSLIFIIALLSLMQDNKRRLAALIFSLLTFSHELFFQSLPGYYYFISAAAIDGLIITVISRLRYTTKLTERLMRVCMCFILLNGGAWIMWEFSINYEFIYETIAAFMYLYIVVSLLSWDGIEDGNHKLDNWAHPFRANNMAINKCYKKS